MKRDELREYFRRAYKGVLLEQDDPFAEEGDEGGEEEGGEKEGGEEQGDEDNRFGSESVEQQTLETNTGSQLFDLSLQR